MKLNDQANSQQKADNKLDLYVVFSNAKTISDNKDQNRWTLTSTNNNFQIYAMGKEYGDKNGAKDILYASPNYSDNKIMNHGNIGKMNTRWCNCTIETIINNNQWEDKLFQKWKDNSSDGFPDRLTFPDSFYACKVSKLRGNSNDKLTSPQK